MTDTQVDLHRHDEEIEGILQTLKENPPAAGEILLYGSSTMANWRADGMCYEQLAPYTIINTGFGGSTAEDALYYYHKLVLPVKPSIMVYYEGANDLNNGYTPENVLDYTHRIFEWCRQDFKGIRFVIVPVKLSPGLIKDWQPGLGEACNAMFKQYADSHDDTTIIDVAGLLYDVQGDHRQDIYVEDQLHHNRKGYEELADIVKAELDRLTSA